jgi:hypothetical protein
MLFNALGEVVPYKSIPKYPPMALQLSIRRLFAELPSAVGEIIEPDATNALTFKLITVCIGATKAHRTKVLLSALLIN